MVDLTRNHDEKLEFILLLSHSLPISLFCLYFLLSPLPLSSALLSLALEHRRAARAPQKIDQ